MAEVKRVNKTKKEPVETTPNLKDKIGDANKEEFLHSISVDTTEISLSDIIKCFTIKVSTLKKLIKDKENRQK